MSVKFESGCARRRSLRRNSADSEAAIPQCKREPHR